MVVQVAIDAAGCGGKLQGMKYEIRWQSTTGTVTPDKIMRKTFLIIESNYCCFSSVLLFSLCCLCKLYNRPLWFFDLMILKLFNREGTNQLKMVIEDKYLSIHQYISGISQSCYCSAIHEL